MAHKATYDAVDYLNAKLRSRASATACGAARASHGSSPDDGDAAWAYRASPCVSMLKTHRVLWVEEIGIEYLQGITVGGNQAKPPPSLKEPDIGNATGSLWTNRLAGAALVLPEN